MAWVYICKAGLGNYKHKTLSSGVTKPGHTRAWARASILECFRNESLSLYPVTTIKLCASSLS